jgi:hypothetical protein
MQIQLNADRLFRIHAGIIVALLAAYAIVNLVALGLGRPRIFGLVALLDLNGERNIPAVFSFVALLAAALIASLIGQRSRIGGRRHAWRWQVLGLTLGYMALDESLEWHEHIGRLFRFGYALPGGWHYSWIIPYAALLAAVVAVCLPLVRSLPSVTRNALILAGGIFVAGAAGMEVIAGLLSTYSPEEVALYRLAVAIEEGAEMFAIALLIRTMVDYGDMA